MYEPRIITVAPVTALAVDTLAYAAYDLIGTGGAPLIFDLSFAKDWGGLTLEQVMLHDLAAQGADIDVVLFGSNPSATTFTDQAALDIADADLSKVIGVASITTDALFNTTDNGVSYARGLNIPIPISQSADPKIWAALVSRGTPTYGAANALAVKMTFKRPN